MGSVSSIVKQVIAGIVAWENEVLMHMELLHIWPETHLATRSLLCLSMLSTECTWATSRQSL